MGTKRERIYHITSARRALSEDVDDRTARYLVTMAIRTACILACALIPTWHRWLFAAGAVLLPMLAVMVASAGREPAARIDEHPSGAFDDDDEVSALPPSAGPLINPDGTIIERQALGPLRPRRPKRRPPSDAERASTAYQRVRHPEWFSDETEFLR